MMSEISHNHLRNSGTVIQFPKVDIEKSIPERFEKIVQMYPHRIAVETDSHAITYAELNAMANRVARVLSTERGNDSEAIALLLEKRDPLMAAMLGVLKAGKFFTLLDSSFSKARNLALLEDSQTGLMITDRENISLAQDMVTDRRCILEFESIDLRISSGNLDLPISPETFATILYTSGSTGDPKGIICDHRDLLHRVMLRTKENCACEHDKIALLPTGTANAVTNSFLALLNGATLCPFDTQKEAVTRLANWLSEQGITICPFSASLFRNFAAALTGKETFSDLRIIRLRSETVYKSDIDLYRKYFPAHCAFVAGLSSSETGQLTTYLLNDDIEITDDGVPVGYPVQDKEILLLDDAGNEVGVNQVGEIVVRSRYLAIGYWRRPDLTEKKFKADPNGNGQRLCFTGDLGLRLPGGCLVHKGRKDFRVKIRGYGVELPAVESRLLDHSVIKEAVVVARQVDSGDAQLVAYYTCQSHSSPNVGELRDFLQEKLPPYMIPSAFVLLDVMPLTSNGKIDRSALPRPGNRRPDLDTVYLPPRTPDEEKLVKLLTAFLSIDQIGAVDNFFDLGGHSLLAARLMSRVQDVFQVDIPLAKFLESPTIAALAKLIERADPGNRQARDFSIKPVARTETLPVSFSQQRLWFLAQLFPQSCAYNMLSAYKLTGQLNVSVLEKSINEIVRRHEVWRTVFTAVDGEPRQVVLPRLWLELQVMDLRETVSNTDRESELHRRLKNEAQAPFDLVRGPLLRAALLRLREDEYVLLLTKHHIAYDGWCRGIIARELTALYQAFSNAQPSPLEELPIQYADFAVWQREWFQGEVLEEQLSFWKKRLEDFQTLQLPTAGPRPSVQTNRGARRYFALSAMLSAAVKDLSHQHDVTLFITLLAAFKTLLHRYTGQTDILVGSPVAGRNRSELEDLIGFFLNMLPLRTDLSGNPTFRHVLAMVRETCFGAYAHQDLPFEKLVEELRPERNLGLNPLFQVTFTLQNTPSFPLGLAGLLVEELEIYSGISRFDLEVYIEEENHRLQGYVNYNMDLFDEVTVIRMLEHFETLLAGIVADPDQRISDLPILSAAEKHQLLVGWNATQAEYPRCCVHKLFEAQVERTPDAVAVAFEDQQLTYQELNCRANQVAHHLQRILVGPEVCVGICIERSVEMVVGLLGILKAGGTYLPLDPAFPEERLAFMLKDSQAQVLLTQEPLLGLLPSTGSHGVCLDRDWAVVAQESQENPSIEVTADNLAYVIYTSGSTGKPKGVQVPHRALVNFLNSMRRQPGLTSGDTILAVTTLSFDIAALEIFLPLLTGASAVVASREVVADGVRLSEELTKYGVTAMQAAPVTWRMLTEAGWQGSDGLKVLCGGEALPGALAAQLLARSSSSWNLYGPTETTVWSAVCQMPRGDGPPPIGRPIDNTQIYILDAHLQPVPIGVFGELHIGGVGLARGYLNCADLTAEKFNPNPFSDSPGARLYKTGDLARYLPDGDIEISGRIDEQVKIRGFRIEPKEIEALLIQHTAVREAVVLAQEATRGEKRLVGYVAPDQNSVVSTSELRSFLKEKLPDYMIPSSFVFLDALPLTANGKVDRKALPEPDQRRPKLKQAFVAPRTPVEEALAEIWSQLLGVEQVGVHDDFFELGGHSLLAARVVSRAHKIFEVEVPLRILFEHPTIAELAVQIAQAEARKTAPQEQEIVNLLTALESLSDEEAEQLLDRSRY